MGQDVTVQQAFVHIHGVVQVRSQCWKILSCPLVMNINPCTILKAWGFLWGVECIHSGRSGWSIEAKWPQERHTAQRDCWSIAKFAWEASKLIDGRMDGFIERWVYSMSRYTGHCYLYSIPLKISLLVFTVYVARWPQAMEKAPGHHWRCWEMTIHRESKVNKGCHAEELPHVMNGCFSPLLD